MSKQVDPQTASKQMEEYEKEQERIQKERREKAEKARRKIFGDGKNLSQLAKESFRLDENRQQMKALLYIYAEEYKNEEVIKNDPKMKKLLGKISQYAQIDTNALDEGNEKRNEENKLVKEIYQDLTKNLTDIENRLEKNVQDIQADTENKVEDLLDDPAFVKQYKMIADLNACFEMQVNGNLDLNIKNEEGAHFVNAVGKPIEMKKSASLPADRQHEIDMSTEPLFPHEPSINDIKQMGLGDCYLMSSLSAIVSEHPEKIKDAIRDNGDGTVTVRFFATSRASEDEPPKKEPVYVQVDKKIPNNSTTAANCLWAQMIERAYVASGLHLRGIDERNTLKSANDARPVPENIDELYEKYKKMPEGERPTKEECPWLFDDNGNLKPWKPDYKDIESGNQGVFLDHFLEEPTDYTVKRLKTVGNADGIVYYNDLMQRLYQENLENNKVPPQKMEAYRQTGEKLKGNAFSKAEVLHAAISGSYQTAEELRSSEETSKELSICSDVMRQISTTMNDLFRDPEKKHTEAEIYDTFMKELDEGVNRRDESENRYFDKVKDFFKENKSLVVSMVNPDLGKKRNYSSREEEIYNEIERAIARNDAVGASTPPHDEGDVKKKNGINYNHAYTVIGVETDIVDGHEVKFVNVRNPHGSNIGREYHFENGTLTSKETDKAKDGITRVELKDFVNDFEYLSINQLSPDKENQKEKGPFTEDKEEKRTISRQDISKYSRSMLETAKFLEELKGGTEQEQKARQELVKSLRDTSKELSYQFGQKRSELGSIIAGGIGGAMNRYKDALEKAHVKEGSRRIKAWHVLDEMVDSAKEGLDSPYDRYKKVIAEKLCDYHLGGKRLDEVCSSAMRDQVLNRIKDHEAVSDKVKSGKLIDYYDLSNKYKAVDFSNHQNIPKDIKDDLMGINYAVSEKTGRCFSAEMAEQIRPAAPGSMEGIHRAVGVLEKIDELTDDLIRSDEGKKLSTALFTAVEKCKELDSDKDKKDRISYEEKEELRRIYGELNKEAKAFLKNPGNAHDLVKQTVNGLVSYSNHLCEALDQEMAFERQKMQQDYEKHGYVIADHDKQNRIDNWFEGFSNLVDKGSGSWDHIRILSGDPPQPTKLFTKNPFADSGKKTLESDKEIFLLKEKIYNMAKQGNLFITDQDGLNRISITDKDDYVVENIENLKEPEKPHSSFGMFFKKAANLLNKNWFLMDIKEQKQYEEDKVRYEKDYKKINEVFTKELKDQMKKGMINAKDVIEGVKEHSRFSVKEKLDKYKRFINQAKDLSRMGSEVGKDKIDVYTANIERIAVREVYKKRFDDLKQFRLQQKQAKENGQTLEPSQEMKKNIKLESYVQRIHRDRNIQENMAQYSIVNMLTDDAKGKNAPEKLESIKGFLQGRDHYPKEIKEQIARNMVDFQKKLEKLNPNLDSEMNLHRVPVPPEKIGEAIKNLNAAVAAGSELGKMNIMAKSHMQTLLSMIDPKDEAMLKQAGLTKQDLKIAKGTIALGTIAERGLTAQTNLKDDRIMQKNVYDDIKASRMNRTLNEQVIQNAAADYMLMKTVNAAMKNFAESNGQIQFAKDSQTALKYPASTLLHVLPAIGIADLKKTVVESKQFEQILSFDNRELSEMVDKDDNYFTKMGQSLAGESYKAIEKQMKEAEKITDGLVVRNPNKAVDKENNIAGPNMN